jgi:hypothetical protein
VGYRASSRVCGSPREEPLHGAPRPLLTVAALAAAPRRPGDHLHTRGRGRGPPGSSRCRVSRVRRPSARADGTARGVDDISDGGRLAPRLCRPQREACGVGRASVPCPARSHGRRQRAVAVDLAFKAIEQSATCRRCPRTRVSGIGPRLMRSEPRDQGTIGCSAPWRVQRGITARARVGLSREIGWARAGVLGGPVSARPRARSVRVGGPRAACHSPPLGIPVVTTVVVLLLAERSTWDAAG